MHLDLPIPSLQNDPFQIIYSQAWQFMLQCSVWPYPAPKRTTLPTQLKLMWMTSDFDSKCARQFIPPLTDGSKFCGMCSLSTELSTFAWQQAPASTPVIRHGDDHTSLLGRSPSHASRTHKVNPVLFLLPRSLKSHPAPQPWPEI
jgi:hypothetical protein